MRVNWTKIFLIFHYITQYALHYTKLTKHYKSLFSSSNNSLPSPPPHAGETRLTEPLALGRSCHAHTRVVEPLVRTVRVVTGNHVPVRDLVTDAISGLVGVVVPLLVTSLGL